VGTTYADALGDALEWLRGQGFEHGPAFANHAPMAAEALARLGYTDAVPAWIEENRKRRHYHPAPEPGSSLDVRREDEWQQALGDFRRVADWAVLFERELAERPWREVLATWWPRLLPGISGVLAHGVIRTAHAVRGLVVAGDGNPLQRAELANGLAYWAARHSGDRTWLGGARRVDRPAADVAARTVAALDELIAGNAAAYAGQRPRFAVPLIHTITAPAAVRLIMAELPADQYWPSYLASRKLTASLRLKFGFPWTSRQGRPASPVPAAGELAAVAIELGDEHAIKLAEVAARVSEPDPDHRHAMAMRAASSAATALLSG
jgi:Questin oxidase-like